MTIGQITRLCPDCSAWVVAMITAQGAKRLQLQCPKCSHQWWEEQPK